MVCADNHLSVKVFLLAGVEVLRSIGVPSTSDRGDIPIIS